MIEPSHGSAKPSAQQVELGLIGSGISRSMAPMLHERLGQLTNRNVTYQLHDLDPSAAPDLGPLLTHLAERGATGINVTHPFKQAVVEHVSIDDPILRAIGAINSVRFETTGSAGFNTAFNTDYTGFQAAYRRRFPNDPGVVAQLGAGGFGRAAAFALAALGADRIRLFDPDHQRSSILADDVSTATGISISAHRSAEAAVAGVDGLINASPIGMYGHPGCPVPPVALEGLAWAFDAVYTPLETDFLERARRAGAEVMSGSQLFFWQGVHAFEIFTRTSLDQSIIDAAAETVRSELDRRAAEGR